MNSHTLFLVIFIEVVQVGGWPNVEPFELLGSQQFILISDDFKVTNEMFKKLTLKGKAVSYIYDDDKLTSMEGTSCVLASQRLRGNFCKVVELCSRNENVLFLMGDDDHNHNDYIK